MTTKKEHMEILKLNDIDRIVSPTEFAYRLSVSTMVLYSLEREGRIPPRVRISKRKTGWKESDISIFIANLK